MATFEKRSFDAPDERRTPSNAEVASVKLGDRAVTRVTYFPGFRWSTDMKPVAGTDLCQVTHLGLVVSGRCRVVMENGTALDLGPGDAVSIPAGHDAWTLGDEPFVTVDFGG
jgi:mannose-6-phosphate isomerase-like protein (cupin superfamily)